MGNNLLAANEPKQNRNTKLVERKIKTRKTENREHFLGALYSPKESQEKMLLGFNHL
jgi:hypothetical protein